MVDVTAEQLTPSPVAAAKHAAEKRPSPTAAAAVSDGLQELLAEFPGTRQLLDSCCQPSHGVQHQIVTEGPPTAVKFCRLDGIKMAAARDEFDKMLRAGIILSIKYISKWENRRAEDICLISGLPTWGIFPLKKSCCIILKNVQGIF
jgi:hypothetical protein